MCETLVNRVTLFICVCMAQSAYTPGKLNEARLPRAFYLTGQFSVVLKIESHTNHGQISSTPSDVQGPFHLPPETIPVGFPPRARACSMRPRCAGRSCQAYTSGLPLELWVSVSSTSGGTVLPGAVVDIWQADPLGIYWKNSNHWRSLSTGNTSQHLFNCRAHGVADAQGRVHFTTLLPGHYVVGSSSWRPRHIHIRASAKGHKTVVTQIYFHGDPFLGEADTACPHCKSGYPSLIVPLKVMKLQSSVEEGEKNDLERKAAKGMSLPFSLANLTVAASNKDSGLIKEWERRVPTPTKEWDRRVPTPTLSPAVQRTSVPALPASDANIKPELKETADAAHCASPALLNGWKSACGVALALALVY